MKLLNAINPFKRESRAYDPSWQELQRDVPTRVTRHLAENLASVIACVQAVSGGIAALPVYIYRRDKNGRHLAPNHSLYRLIKEGPNRYQTWPDFIEQIASEALLSGNAIIEVKRDRRGQVMEMTVHPFSRVSVILLPSGRLAYDISPGNTVSNQAYKPYRLLDTEVVHIKDRSDDGHVGRSRLSRAASSIALAASTQDYTASLMRNSMSPRGKMSFPRALSPQQQQDVKASMKEFHSGADNAGKTLILDHGTEYEPISGITPEDAELLNSRRFSGEEIARIFGVPPAIIGDLSHGTFTNSETAGRWFAQHTLTPWIRKIEAAFTQSVFTERERKIYEFDIDLSGMLRGDPETRWASHKIAIETGVLDADEIREIEGWNPRVHANG